MSMSLEFFTAGLIIGIETLTADSGPLTRKSLLAILEHNGILDYLDAPKFENLCFLKMDFSVPVYRLL